MLTSLRYACVALTLLLAPGVAAGYCLQASGDEPLSTTGVSIIGAVEEPGVLEGLSDQRVGDAIDAAGGLREDAYPLGAMLLRRLPEARGRMSDAMIERDLAADALDGLQVALSGPNDDARRMRLVAELRAGGRYARVPVAVDAALQHRFPERNVRLAPGDVLFVPARPTTVTVIGAVRSPGQFAFATGSMADNYVEEAGGWLPGARKKRSAVYLPDGTLRELSMNFWNYEPTAVPPGSIIVVPYRDESLQKYARKMLGASMFAELAQRQKEADAEAADGEALSLLPQDPATEYRTYCR